MFESTFEDTAPVQDERIEVVTKDRSGSRFVFFAGNLLSPQNIILNPGWFLGGVIRDGFVVIDNAVGYIPRCEITTLKQRFESENAQFINPTERRHKVKSYTIHGEDGKARTIGADDHLLREAVYPADVIGRLTGQNDGVVEMPVRNVSEKIAAQNFLFPNWNAIKRGVDKFPPTMQQLRQHFERRLQAAQKEGSELFTQVCLAAIKSCDQFINFCQVRLSETKATYERHKTKGEAWTMGGENEQIFALVGESRPDMASAAQSTQINDLAGFMKQAAEMQAAGQQSQQQFMQMLAGMLLQNNGGQLPQIPTPAAPAQPVSTVSTQTEGVPAATENQAPQLDAAKCQATKKDGDQCTAAPINNTPFCHNHRNTVQETITVNE